MAAAAPRFSIGVDYGTNSARAIVVDVRNGREVAEAVYAYPTGVKGIILDPKDQNLARQNPLDYIKAFDRTVAEAVTVASGSCRGFHPDRVVGIGVDATSSTPIPVDRRGRALASDPAFRGNPAAMAWLWKDHCAWAEAAEITAAARDGGYPYLDYCGGEYSSEWFWSKILHCLRTAPKVFRAAHSWVEQGDFVTAYAVGHADPQTLVRGICAAGHKAMYSDLWGGLPSEAFLATLSPELAALRSRLFETAVAVDVPAGRLDAGVARRVGLPSGIPVAAAVVDGHIAAVGAGVRPGVMAKILGTSGCDMMVIPPAETLEAIPGICGVVPGSIVPGMTGLEAGQSAVGDIFNWWVGLLGGVQGGDGALDEGRLHARLTREAATLAPGASGLLALDWNNGNRNVLADPLLSGLLVGQGLHTTAAEVYRALIEAVAFGALTIINRFEHCGVKAREIVACGGIADKNPMVMQIMADVCGRPIKLSASTQCSALGAAICGAVVGGAYRTVPAAQRAMAAPIKKTYRPGRKARAVYADLFKLYSRLHDGFGGVDDAAVAEVMKKLLEIRRAATA